MLTRWEGSCWAGVPLTWSGRGCRPVYPAAAGLLRAGPIVVAAAAGLALKRDDVCASLLSPSVACSSLHPQAGAAVLIAAAWG